MEKYENESNIPIKDRRLYAQAQGMGAGFMLHVWLMDQIVGSQKACDDLDEITQRIYAHDMEARQKANDDPVPFFPHVQIDPLLEVKLQNGRYLQDVDPIELERLCAAIKNDFRLASDVKIYSGGGPAFILIEAEDAAALRIRYPDLLSSTLAAADAEGPYYEDLNVAF